MSLTASSFEYVNEDTIDDELMCSICTQPFQSPVSLDCKHTFCESCIEVWIKQNASCPMCRCRVGTGYVLTKVTSPNVCNQLDCLLVRCLRCKKDAIQRIKFNGHFRRCSKSKITRVSDSFRNRWHSFRETTRKKRHRQTTTPDQATLHPATTRNTTEATNIRRRELDALYRDLPEVPFRTRPPQQRPPEPILNPHVRRNSERTGWAVFCILVLVLVLCFWRTNEEQYLLFPKC